MRRHPGDSNQTINRSVNEINFGDSLDRERAFAIVDGRWEQAIPAELSVIGKLVLRGTRIIIPSSLRDQLLHLAHEGHPRIVSMKSWLRTKVCWSGCDKDLEMFCKTCLPGQVVSMPKPPEPLKWTELPSGPWQRTSATLWYHLCRQETISS